MLDSLDIQDRILLKNSFGENTAAKFDFLYAGREGNRVGVNRTHCRPLHPHGKRLVDEGLMTLQREGTKSCKHSALVITQKGLDELDRLSKKMAKRLKKNTDAPVPKPTTRNFRLSPSAKKRLTAAIAFSKGQYS